MEIASLEDLINALMSAPSPDEDASCAAAARNRDLTKPHGALGRLEEIAVWYAGWRGNPTPRIRAPQILVFAGNHGIAVRGVSAFPAEVTVQMVENFRMGGAAINQLANCFGASLAVHALELGRPTADFTEAPAMAEAEFLVALKTGWDAVDPESDLLVTGEMGIGNTTSAAAIACAMLGGDAQEWVGRGTGVDMAGLARKAETVVAGLNCHGDNLKDPMEVLRRLGGREIAAMAGAITRARVLRIPVLLDGFICCAAALPLARAVPGALDHCLAGHQSAEAAHGRLLDALGKRPLLSLGLRLGEGSGAALAIAVVQGALASHSGMATFAEAGVSAG
ncbi:MAG: nicotinate-nucleotide--dimethylbenzimidazole phosphoribosyltransferase [Pseudorhodobacter sp.]